MSDLEVAELEDTAAEEAPTDSDEAPDDVQLNAETEEVSAESATDEDGQPRDPQGRFAPKGEQEPLAEGVVEETADAPAPDTDESQHEPFSFKADRQEYTIEGAIRIPGEGLAIPEDQVEQVAKLLSEGAYFRTNWRKQEQGYKAEIERLKSAPQSSEAEERANALLKQLDQVLSDPEAAMNFIANLEIQGPVLRERARAEMLQAKLTGYESQTKTQKQQQDAEQLETDKQQAWGETFEQLKGDQTFKLFTPADWNEFEEEMASYAGSLFVQQADGLYLNEAAIVQAAKKRLAIFGRVTQQASAVNKATAFNAARQASSTKVPPAPQGNRTTQTASETEEKQPANWDEWKKKNGIY